MKIYIAYPVTNEMQEMEAINSLITKLSKRYDIIKPQQSSLPKIIANRAIKYLNNTDLILADVTNYSHGVGFELGYAYAFKRNIIVIANISHKARVSKFLKGLFPQIIYYRDASHLINRISKFLDRLATDK